MRTWTPGFVEGSQCVVCFRTLSFWLHDNLLSYSVLHLKPTTSWLDHLRKHSWCWDKPRATLTHWTHHGPDSEEATTFLHIVFSALLHRTHPNGFYSRDSQGGVPKLSRFGLLGLWELIIPSSDF